MVEPSKVLELNLRRWILSKDENDHTVWREVVAPVRVPASRTAIVICDMWDNHWSRGAAERVDAMAPRMNTIVNAARDRGIHIIHAPSDTLDAYAGTPARQRAVGAPVVTPPADLPHDDPPLPIDDSDEGSDTGETEPTKAWRCQHLAIEIDQTRDAISADGGEVYNLLRLWDVHQLLIMGVHTNMCILNRSFAVKQMVRWAVPIALVRDLTDAMYNPARAPYVSHAEGTGLVIGYIERFWCPSIDSQDLA
ncbi:MAG: isochorismatase family protein [Anaerolineae bacterium]|nr:isochorismatase family protein [Anaerolineae bacterium]